jgi:MoaA/NifB/PqqE/SkfB family radical SAM enzyme
VSIFGPVEQHRTLSVMPTFRCPAECGHCGTMSSPRERTVLSLESILSAIDQAAELGYEVVVFTGGEPTLARRPLLTALQRATDLGLITRVVTNGYWARTAKAADRTMAQLVGAGLREIKGAG